MNEMELGEGGPYRLQIGEEPLDANPATSVQRELEKLAARIAELEGTHAARIRALEAAVAKLGHLVSGSGPAAPTAAETVADNKLTQEAEAPSLKEMTKTTLASGRRTSSRRASITVVASIFDGSDGPKTIP